MPDSIFIYSNNVLNAHGYYFKLYEIIYLCFMFWTK